MPCLPSTPGLLGDSTPPAQPLQFRRGQRLTHDLEYQRVYQARVGVTRGNGALRVHVLARPVAPGQPIGPARLGLSVPRRVGTAVVRNRLKRLVREAFRLSQRALPGGVDVVVQINPHAERPLTDYARWLVEACAAAGERGGGREGRA